MTFFCNEFASRGCLEPRAPSAPRPLPRSYMVPLGAALDAFVRKPWSRPGGSTSWLPAEGPGSAVVSTDRALGYLE